MLFIQLLINFWIIGCTSGSSEGTISVFPLPIGKRTKFQFRFLHRLTTRCRNLFKTLVYFSNPTIFMLLYWEPSINDVSPEGEGVGGGYKNGNLGQFPRLNLGDKEREGGHRIRILWWRHKKWKYQKELWNDWLKNSGFYHHSNSGFYHHSWNNIV